LLSNDAETPATRRLRLALDGATFHYRAGQAALLSVDDCEPAPYSIASSPSDTERLGCLEFLVKVDGATRFGACAADLRPERAIQIDGPAGGFTLNGVDETAPLLFVAGGTGIAPLRSMIRQALDDTHRGKISLVYSARTRHEFAFFNEWRDLADQQRIALTLTLTGEAGDWEHARGRTGPMHLSDLVRENTVAVICGPRMMVSDVTATLTGLGIPAARIRTEGW